MRQHKAEVNKHPAEKVSVSAHVTFSGRRPPEVNSAECFPDAHHSAVRD